MATAPKSTPVGGGRIVLQADGRGHFARCQMTRTSEQMVLQRRY